MSDSNIILKLEEQIALLQEELRKERQKQDSLWNSLFEAFVREGNPKENAEFWANCVSEVLLDWAKGKRDRLAKDVVTTGNVPPYSLCLNDLVVDLTPPGQSPPKFEEFSVELPENLRQIDPTPPPLGNPQLSADAQIGPAKMKRVNVPKPIPGAVPIGLPPDEKPTLIENNNESGNT